MVNLVFDKVTHCFTSNFAEKKLYHRRCQNSLKSYFSEQATFKHFKITINLYQFIQIKKCFLEVFIY